jgi:type I restriction enzyme S subunit
MANSYLPQPPLEEQECIIAHIENSGIKYDALISRAEREIELVREYRTRLISDVVTGQVDVRGIAVPDVTPEDLSEPVDDTVDEEDLAELNPEEEPVEA